MKVAGPAARILGLAVIYVAAARLGLALDAVAGFATVVWPPTGIALAAILLFGYRLWPGIALGAVAANLWVGAALPVAIGIAIGNTAEAVLAGYLLRRFSHFRSALDRVVDVVALIGLAAALSTIVSASTGVVSLYLGGVIPAGQILETWRAWWVGDLIGDLLVAPVILVWARRPRFTASPRRWAEAGALGLAVLLVSGVTFLRSTPLAEAAIIPVLIWAALRFGPRGAATASFAVSVVAVWGTSLGHGPFVHPQLRDSLLALQTFMGIVAATFLFLGASFAERKRALGEARMAREKADQANRAKAEFLAVMSHELRTPLNAISGYVDLLTLGVQGPLTDEQREALARIQRNQQHLLSLIEDILSFAKTEAGRIAIASERVGICGCIDSVEPIVMPDLRRRDLTFVRASCDDTIVARADPEKLHQILINLLSNAAKYTERGGQVSIGADRSGNIVRIWVADTGIGMTKDQLARVFEPFFQVERGPTRRYSGVGLGLTIARDLAWAMGGDLVVESQPGVGTTATVLLPAA